MNKEYAIWGTRNGVEDIVRVNGQEVQTSQKEAEAIKTILLKRGEFESIRIQVIDFDMPLENDFKNLLQV